MSVKGLRYSAESAADGGKAFDILYILKAVCIAYAVSAVLLFAAAAAASFWCFSDKGVSIAVNLVTALSVLLCGFMSGRHSLRGGIISGAAAGIFYALVLCVVGNIIAQTVSFGINALTAVIIGLVCGAAGGIVGINTKNGRRR